MCEYQGPDDTGGCEAYSEKWRRARVTHECGECGGKIAIGETYRFISGVWEGVGDSFKTCAACVAIGKEFKRAHDGEGFYLGALDEALSECVEEETTINDNDEEILSDSGLRWQMALDQMRARRSNAKGGGS